MTPQHFPESNITFKKPTDLEKSQCQDIPAYHGAIKGGSLDGAMIVITCWHPSEEEVTQIVAGKPIFLSFIGGLPPHFACTSFAEAISVA